MKYDVTCIACPIGCKMTVTKINNEYTVRGNTCKRGEKYGIDEVTNPKRVITSTVRLDGAYLKLLPVKTNGSIPKELMFDIMQSLNKITIRPPITVGDIIIKNILDTGIDIVSCKTII